MVSYQKSASGVTLLEVLFSMMIAAIGLLGAIALLPVAIEQANKGRQADAQAIAGEAAVNDFKVRGYHYWDNWVWHDGAKFTKPLDFTKGVCFDPLAVSHHRENTGYEAKYNLFPTVVIPTTPVMPQMIRVGVNDGMTTKGPLPIPFSVAETCVKSFDELRYDRPQDRSLDAVQRYTQPGNLRREIEPLREFSWFATLAPSILNSDEFILGMVVIYRRQLPSVAPPSLTATPPTWPVAANAADDHEERIVSVNFLGSGDTGGEVTLTTDSQDPKYLDMLKGDWIMLSGVTTYTDPTTGTTINRNHYRWYRVIDTEPTAAGAAGSYTRNVTLFGADWPASVVTQGTIVRGVKAVYERTIRLQQANFGGASSGSSGSGGGPIGGG